MKAKIGDVLECEFGTGKLVACTKTWAILREDSGSEIGVYLPDNWIAFPAEIEEEQTEESELDVE